MRQDGELRYSTSPEMQACKAGAPFNLEYHPDNVCAAEDAGSPMQMYIKAVRFRLEREIGK